MSMGCDEVDCDEVDCDEVYYIKNIERKDVDCDEVPNEYWSSEMGGAKRRSHMGPPFGRPHKSYFLVIEKWVIYQ